MSEVYISCDIEADGPIPGPHSMLSIGAAAYSEDKKVLSTFYANFETLPYASGDPDTMEWWKGQPKAWEECRKDLQNPAIVMRNFVDWVKQFDKRVLVAYPLNYDGTFIRWYLMFFAKEDPFNFAGLCIKTYAAATLKGNYLTTTKRTMPKKWFDEGLPHTHNALDDAIEQGALFINILRHNKGLI